MNNVIKIQPVPDHAQLLEISKQANAQHLHFITRGNQAALCSIVPAGWKVIRVATKKAA
jgi:hypothetical protein